MEACAKRPWPSNLWPLFLLLPLCPDRTHGGQVFGDMVYTSSDEGEDRDVPFAERRVSDLREATPKGLPALLAVPKPLPR